MLRSRTARALLVASALLAAGQIFLLMVAGMTRAAGTFAESAGPAILVPDSTFYLRPASFVEVFQLPWTRWGYPLLLTAAPEWIEAPALAVLVNALFVLGAGVALYRVVDAIAGSLPATIATGILLLNPMTAQWVRIVLTESVFYSLVVIIAALGHRLICGRATRSTGAALFISVVLATFTRPNGFLLGTSVLLLLVITRTSGWQRTLSAATVLGATLLMLALALDSAGPPAEGSLTSQLYQGVVVEGTENVRTTIQMPAPSDSSDESLAAAARYAFTHPVATVRLGVTRLAMETAQVRRHYPLVVNIAFGLAMLVFLGSAAAGWVDRRARASRTVFLVIGIPLMLVTMATFAVPEARYGWAYLLPLSPIAGIGADRAVNFLRSSCRR